MTNERKLIDILSDPAKALTFLMLWGDHLGQQGAEDFYWYKNEKEKIEFFKKFLENYTYGEGGAVDHEAK